MGAHHAAGVVVGVDVDVVAAGVAEEFVEDVGDQRFPFGQAERGLLLLAINTGLVFAWSLDSFSSGEQSRVVTLVNQHRVSVGDSALVVAVASAHRAEAFEACRELVDEVKHRLPVWKHQVFADGTDEWVNCA